MTSIISKRWFFAVGGSLLLVGGVSLAGVNIPGKMLTAGDNPSDVTDAAKLSVADSLARSQQMQMQMSTTEVRVGSLQKRAETKKDMVMVNCVSDKLVQVRGYVAIGTVAGQGVQTAAQRGDDAGRVHHFERQTIVYQKVLVLGTEAEGCIGEDVSYIGATRVDVEIDPNIPQEDPTIPANHVPVADRPPEGACPNA